MESCSLSQILSSHILFKKFGAGEGTFSISQKIWRIFNPFEPLNIFESVQIQFEPRRPALCRPGLHVGTPPPPCLSLSHTPAAANGPAPVPIANRPCRVARAQLPSPVCQPAPVAPMRCAPPVAVAATQSRCADPWCQATLTPAPPPLLFSVWPWPDTDPPLSRSPRVPTDF
jgi:hypothetical protein